MKNQYKNKTVVVTGGASGIGQAIAKRFIADGANVLVFDLKAPRFPAQFFRVDVTNETAIKHAFTKIKKLDILINCAGVYVKGPIEQLQKADIHHILDVNLVGPMLMCKFALPLLKKSRGQIVNISSMLAFHPKAANFLYPITKAGVTLFTQALAQDYGRTKVRVNAIAPGPIANTALHPEMNYSSKAMVARELKKRNVPMNRFGKPEEVAALVAYVCSKEADFIHGATLTIDGGRAAML